jgi:hypothetical protein
MIPFWLRVTFKFHIPIARNRLARPFLKVKF